MEIGDGVTKRPRVLEGLSVWMLKPSRLRKEVSRRGREKWMLKYFYLSCLQGLKDSAVYIKCYLVYIIRDLLNIHVFEFHQFRIFSIECVFGTQ